MSSIAARWGALAVSAMAASVMTTAWAQPAPAEKPNIVIILADDMGYGDIGSFGNPNIRTHRLDRMVTEGQKWTNFYVQPVCTPSRAALLTGRLPLRSGMYGRAVHDKPKVLFDDAMQGLPLAEITIAELLKTRGYATAIIGKWHLGHLPKFLPTQQGFDYWFGLQYSHDMAQTFPREQLLDAYHRQNPHDWDVPLMRNNDVVERPVDFRTLTRRYTEESVRFIREHRDAPFLLYLAHNLPHTPLGRSREFDGHSSGGIYGDVIEELDWSTGRILDTLKELRLERNTLVVFTSDNGPWLIFDTHGGSSGPLRDGKGTTWEGGVRAPAIFWWPGTIAPAVVTDIGSQMDLFVTAAKLAGAALPSDREIDGVDLTAPLTGTGTAPARSYFYYWDDVLMAVRKGNYKAAFVTASAFARFLPGSASGAGEDWKQHDPPLLFNLAEDPGERHDIAARHPKILAELVREAESHRRQMRPGPPLFDDRSPAAPAKPNGGSAAGAKQR